MIFC